MEDCQQQQQQQNKNYYEGAITSSATGNQQQQLSATTTRVLTDEKGHSIKIRIASPPPQRQSQLAKLHQKQQQQQQQLIQQQQQFQHRDSVASDSPLMFDHEQALLANNERRFSENNTTFDEQEETQQGHSLEVSKSQRTIGLSSNKQKKKANQRPQSSMARYNNDDNYWNLAEGAEQERDNSSTRPRHFSSGDKGGTIGGDIRCAGAKGNQKETPIRSSSISARAKEDFAGNKWVEFEEEGSKRMESDENDYDDDDNDDDDEVEGVFKSSGHKSLVLIDDATGNCAPSGGGGGDAVAKQKQKQQQQQQRLKSKQRRRHSHAYLVAGGFKEAASNSSSRESEVYVFFQALSGFNCFHKFFSLFKISFLFLLL